MKKLILITGVSCSGKTTTQQELLNRGWVRPINFTTRLPRSEEELDEYVFLTKQQFAEKMLNGDFLEITQGYGKFYGINSSFLKEDAHDIGDNVCIIVDPVGRAQIIEWCSRNNVPVKTFYIDISKEEQSRRLRERGDGEEEITKRLKDFEWFYPTPSCTILEGTTSTKTLADIIETYDKQ